MSVVIDYVDDDNDGNDEDDHIHPNKMNAMVVNIKRQIISNSEQTAEMIDNGKCI